MADAYGEARQRFGTGDVADPLLARLLGDWLAACPVGAPPGLDFISPVALHYMLGFLVILDVIEGRFRYRLVGSEIVGKRGQDLTGTWLEDHIDPVVAEAGGRSCALVVESRAPVLQHFRYEADGRPHGIETLFLPVLGAEGAVTRILIGQAFSAGAPNIAFVSRGNEAR